jgi:hypothetical protein
MIELKLVIGWLEDGSDPSCAKNAHSGFLEKGNSITPG